MRIICRWGSNASDDPESSGRDGVDGWMSWVANINCWGFWAGWTEQSRVTFFHTTRNSMQLKTWIISVTFHLIFLGLDWLWVIETVEIEIMHKGGLLYTHTHIYTHNYTNLHVYIGNHTPLKILAWKISWTQEPGKLPSMGSWRVRHNWVSTYILVYMYMYAYVYMYTCFYMLLHAAYTCLYMLLRQEALRRSGVAIIVNKRVWNVVLGCNLKNDRMIFVHFQGKPFNITVI